MITTAAVRLMLSVHVQGSAPNQPSGMSALRIIRPGHLWFACPLSLQRTVNDDRHNCREKTIFTPIRVWLRVLIYVYAV